MTIQITPDGFIPLSGDAPEVGKVYALEDASEGSLAQGRAFHALIQEFWKSGLHSYDVACFDEFRNCIKRDYGAGFESFVYADFADGLPVIREAKAFDEIPEYVRKDPRRAELIRGRLKSWSEYSKTERREAIDAVISTMHQAGVQSKKFYEILEGMEQ